MLTLRIVIFFIGLTRFWSFFFYRFDLNLFRRVRTPTLVPLLSKQSNQRWCSYLTEYIQLFRQRLSKKSVRAYAKLRKGSFNKSSESILPAISSLSCTVEALWILSFYRIIGYFPDSSSAAYAFTLFFFLDNLCRNSCIMIR